MSIEMNSNKIDFQMENNDEGGLDLETAPATMNQSGERVTPASVVANLRRPFGQSAPQVGQTQTTQIHPHQSHERHRLLQQIDIGEGRNSSRRIDDDDDWDDFCAVIPVLVVLLGFIVVAVVLWPIISFDPTKFISVNGGQLRLFSVDSNDFSVLSITASFLFSGVLPRLESNSLVLANDHLEIDFRIPNWNSEQDFSNSATTAENVSIAHAHIFYNTPPVAIPANRTFNRSLNIVLDNFSKDNHFSALRYEVIEGGNVSVKWNFDGGRPDFLVLSSQTAFDLWRSDSIPPLNYQMHHEYSTAKGSYVLTGKPSDIYYFIFSAPTFNTSGTIVFNVSPMEYDLSGKIEHHPQPVISCAFELVNPEPPNKNLHSINELKSTSSVSAIFYDVLSKIMKILTFSDHSSSTLLSITNNQTVGAKATTFVSIPPNAVCQTVMPNPKFIRTVHVLLLSPPALPHQQGGTGFGNRDSSPVDTEGGTLDSRTTVFKISPTVRDGSGPGPFLFFIWAFCAVIGLSVGVAVIVGVTVWLVSWGISWVRVMMGWESPSGGDDADTGPEPLPLYVAREEVFIETDHGELGGLPPPPYAVFDPVVAAQVVADAEQYDEFDVNSETVNEIEGSENDRASEDAPLLG
ncbi:hypothetical protein HK100_005367 [Physocladia obscura]|uniref:Uncharacterized protein n=1 Tax=Physocladia obscura TaxID=109957 RepID=A0AAD5SU81_9FUNG|nr:hypothetical protein HK100_005367 [Physocladia obscura]